MEKMQKFCKVAFCLLGAAGLGCVTAVLLGGRETSDGYEHCLKLYGAGVLWFVFLVYAFHPEAAAQFSAISKRLDRKVLFLVVALILIVILAHVLHVPALSAIVLGFLCYVFRPKTAARFNVIPKRFDGAALFPVIVMTIVMLLAHFLQMLADLRILPAIPLGIFCAGLFCVLRDTVREEAN